MYQYYHNPKHHLLIIRHFEGFIGAETTVAIVTINKLLTEKVMRSLKALVIDFRKVSSATLYDTDRALHSLLHSELTYFPPNLPAIRLYDIDNPATKILVERINRTEDMIVRSFKSTIKPVIIYNEQEIPALLNLPQDVIIIDDSLDWLSPPENTNLLR